MDFELYEAGPKVNTTANFVNWSYWMKGYDASVNMNANVGVVSMNKNARAKLSCHLQIYC